MQWELTRGAWDTRNWPFWKEKPGLKKGMQNRVKSVFRIRRSICFWDSGSGSFHEQAKKWRKTLILLFCDFFMTFFLKIYHIMAITVPDPWNFGVDPDSDPRIQALTNGSGFGSCYFRHWPSRCQQKNKFFKKFFCLILFEGTFTSFFKDKKSKRSHKTVGIKVLTIFACW